MSKTRIFLFLGAPAQGKHIHVHVPADNFYVRDADGADHEYQFQRIIEDGHLFQVFVRRGLSESEAVNALRQEIRVGNVPAPYID